MSPIVPPTLRDYYAATAPAEIPEWFTSGRGPLVLPPKPLGVSDSSPEVYAWLKENARIKRDYEAAHHCAWRWYYADQMIKADPESKARSL